MNQDSEPVTAHGPHAIATDSPIDNLRKDSVLSSSSRALPTEPEGVQE